jgi:mannose-6-phosphate isomerase-like protein (cupin superfamily)
MLVAENGRRDAFIMERGDGRPIHVVGDEVTIKISSRDTGGAFTVFEGRTRPLHGPPLHLHRDQDEWWYILEGEYRFQVDGQEIHAGAGATVFAPRGSRHTFQNIGATPGRMVTTVVPGGLDLFFEELETVVPRGTVPDPAKMVPIFEKHNLELLGPPLASRPMAGSAT